MFIFTLVLSRTHADTVQIILHILTTFRHFCWSHTMRLLSLYIPGGRSLHPVKNRWEVLFRMYAKLLSPGALFLDWKCTTNHVVTVLRSRGGGRERKIEEGPRTPRPGGTSRMFRGIMLGVKKNF